MEKNEKIQISMDELETIVGDAIGKALKDQGVDKVDARHAIHPATAEVDGLDIEKMPKEKRIKHFLRAALGVGNSEDMAVLKELSEGTTTAGGYLVPDDYRTDVIRVAEQFGVARNECFTFSTDTDVIYPTVANAVYSAAWVNESATISEENMSLAQKTITIKKAATLQAITNELLADAKFPLVTYLAELAGEAIAGLEDTEFLQGTGSPFQGIMYSSLTGAVATTAVATSYTSFTADDFLSLPVSLAAKYRAGGKFFMHPTVFSYVQKLKDENGQYIYQSPKDASDMNRLWGYPVVLSEKAPSTDAVSTIFVAFTNAKRTHWFADRQQMAVAITDSGTLTTAGNLFEQDLSAIRFTERVGMVSVLPAGVAQLKTAAA